MEEEVVLTIDKYLWRKRRHRALFADEAGWLREHPDGEDLRQLLSFDQFFQKGMSCRDARKLPRFSRASTHRLDGL